MAIALPLTESEFFTSLSPESLKDYAKSRARHFGHGFSPRGLWEHDHKNLLHLIDDIVRRVRELGVNVKLGFGLADFDDPNFLEAEVFTLVAHWVDEKQAVELSDGLHPVSKLVEHVPKNFRGAFDLTVCRSLALQDALKVCFPENIVVGNAEPAMLEIRLPLYLAVIEWITLRPMHFVSARVEITRKLLATDTKIHNFFL